MTDSNPDFQKTCDDFEKNAILCSKKITDSLQETMGDVLRQVKIDNEEQSHIFQARVCDLVSVTILSICIRILKDHSFPDASIRKVCEAHIQQAIDFANMANYRRIKDH